ncbi:MAG TPA: DUF4340 domain-containing protein [Saprospiraceae bacterium]|nr:DUF4340 domain-containing protein [Saprospiraceae bacterium]HMP23184.1 DUF4340 domain-containing protein [Saprospiraceae bacterium]
MNTSKKTLLLLIAFALLGAIATWYLLTQPDDQTTLAGADRQFAIANTDVIYKIFIADRQGSTTTLERRDGYWMYNGQYRARPNAIDNLLDAIRRVQVKYKPPTAAVKHMVSDLATQGLKVELYDKNNRLLKTYYVGGATADERGTYMIMDRAEQPYVTHIPSWEGNLRFRYSLKGDDWRDKTIFAYRPEDVQAVVIEYPKQRNNSFRLARAGQDFRVQPFYEVTPVINRPLRSGVIEAYIEGFRSLGAEAFENKNPRRDSVLQLIPFSIISVTDKNGVTTTARLYPIFPEPIPGATRLPDANVVERYFAALDNGDFMLIQHHVFKKILWGYEFFFQPAEAG